MCANELVHYTVGEDRQKVKVCPSLVAELFSAQVIWTF